MKSDLRELLQEAQDMLEEYADQCDVKRLSHQTEDVEALIDKIREWRSENE